MKIGGQVWTISGTVGETAIFGVGVLLPVEGVGHGVVVAHTGLQFGGRQGFGHATGLQPDKPGGIVIPGKKKKN